MPLIVNELHRRDLNIPGSDRRRGDQPRFGRRILLTEQEELLRAGCLLLQRRL